GVLRSPPAGALPVRMKRSRLRLAPAAPGAAAPVAAPSRLDAVTSPVMAATHPGSGDEGGGVQRGVFVREDRPGAEVIEVSWTDHWQSDALRNPDDTGGNTGSRRT